MITSKEQFKVIRRIASGNTINSKDKEVLMEMLVDFVLEDTEFIYQLEVPYKNDWLEIVRNDPVGKEAMDLVEMYE